MYINSIKFAMSHKASTIFCESFSTFTAEATLNLKVPCGSRTKCDHECFIRLMTGIESIRRCTSRTSCLGCEHISAAVNLFEHARLRMARAASLGHPTNGFTGQSSYSMANLNKTRDKLTNWARWWPVTKTMFLRTDQRAGTITLTFTL